MPINAPLHGSSTNERREGSVTLMTILRILLPDIAIITLGKCKIIHNHFGTERSRIKCYIISANVITNYLYQNYCPCIYAHLNHTLSVHSFLYKDVQAELGSRIKKKGFYKVLTETSF